MARERPRKMPSDNDAKLNRNGGKAKADISIYGQESNYLVIALRRLNRGVFAELFHKDVGCKHLNHLVWLLLNIVWVRGPTKRLTARKKPVVA